MTKESQKEEEENEKKNDEPKDLFDLCVDWRLHLMNAMLIRWWAQKL